jgi:hypothetical protein
VVVIAIGTHLFITANEKRATSDSINKTISQIYDSGRSFPKINAILCSGVVISLRTRQLRNWGSIPGREFLRKTFKSAQKSRTHLCALGPCFPKSKKGRDVILITQFHLVARVGLIAHEIMTVCTHPYAFTTWSIMEHSTRIRSF